MGWYLKVVRDNYANLNGRASRQEYWTFLFINFIFGIVAVVADISLGTAFIIGEGTYSVSMGYGWIYSLYTLSVMAPGIAVVVRRLHDVGKSGWMMFVALIPFIGVIWLFVLLVTDSNPGENNYGPSPKG
ncbi:DUF805 domain-containing protein [bacterium]|nr:DUF805 domain-containing protein [bacterium]